MSGATEQSRRDCSTLPCMTGLLPYNGSQYSISGGPQATLQVMHLVLPPWAGLHLGLPWFALPCVSPPPHSSEYRGPCPSRLGRFLMEYFCLGMCRRRCTHVPLMHVTPKTVAGSSGPNPSSPSIPLLQAPRAAAFLILSCTSFRTRPPPQLVPCACVAGGESSVGGQVCV